MFEQLLNQRKKSSAKMHHPPKKTQKTIRSEFVMGTALVIGRQLLQQPKFKQGRLREGKNARSLITKQKFVPKFQQVNLQFNQLKVDGKEINSAFGVQGFKLKSKSKNVNAVKYLMQNPTVSLINTICREKVVREMHTEKRRDEERNQSSKSYPNIMTDNEGLKQNEFEENGVFPGIGTKDLVISSNPPCEKKSYQYRSSQRQSDRQNSSLRKMSKRRDTVIETSSNYKQKLNFNDDGAKNKPEFKKAISLLQFRQFLLTITLTNRLLVFAQQDVQYKAYVCKGNNGLLVKSIIKTRPWWSLRTSNDIDSCHLVWTEWKRNKSMNLLSLKPHKDAAKIQPSGFSLNIKTGNKQIREKMEKKFSNFQKIIGKNTNLCSRYDDSILIENYLNFTAKLNTKAFEDTAQKSLGAQGFDVLNRTAQKKIVNHIPGCLYLHSKKLLFLSMSKYYQRLQKDVFSVIPMTFLISKGITDPEFQKFCKYFQQAAARSKSEKKGGVNIWICKPGQNSNRGNGIQVVSSIGQIRSLINQKCGASRTLIIQKYIQNPYLYNKRKFDIRCYALITCVNGCVKGYWYEQGYVRTTSQVYTLKNLDNKLIHLTNDAIQKKGEEYGKFQNFNKISMAELERYIEANTEAKFRPIYERIREIATQLIESVAVKINPQHKEFCFQVVFVLRRCSVWISCWTTG